MQPILQTHACCFRHIWTKVSHISIKKLHFVFSCAVLQQSGVNLTLNFSLHRLGAKYK